MVRAGSREISGALCKEVLRAACEMQRASQSARRRRAPARQLWPDATRTIEGRMKVRLVAARTPSTSRRVPRRARTRDRDSGACAARLLTCRCEGLGETETPFRFNAWSGHRIRMARCEI